MSNPYDAYLENKVLGASPMELLQMLYQGAIESIRAARLCVRSNDVMGRSRAITKAQAIVMELAASVDERQSPNLTRRLVELYAYLQQRLAEAHFQQREEPLAEAQRLLEVLLEGWRECRVKLEAEAESAKIEAQAIQTF